MRICYCEDEMPQAQLWKKKVLDWAGEQKVSVQCDWYAGAEEFLICSDSCTYDLIFLDIAMKDMNGMELARIIRKRDKQVLLVFVTSDPGYVFEGYEVGAYRYLMKPMEDEKLREVLEYARGRQGRLPEGFVARTENGNERIDYENVLYVEAQGHYVVIHCREGESISLKANFADISRQMQVESTLFATTHRSYLVNLARITRNECILMGGQTVPISRSAYRALNEAFIKYNLGN